VSVRVGTAEPFAYACVEFVCVCGATAHEHGPGAQSLPQGWARVEPAREEGEAEELCPHCAAVAGVSARVS
jgi:hypothetical protein